MPDGICFNLFSVTISLINTVIILVSFCYTGKKYPINWVKKTLLLLWMLQKADLILVLRVFNIVSRANLVAKLTWGKHKTKIPILG